MQQKYINLQFKLRYFLWELIGIRAHELYGRSSLPMNIYSTREPTYVLPVMRHSILNLLSVFDMALANLKSGTHQRCFPVKADREMILTKTGSAMAEILPPVKYENKKCLLLFVGASITYYDSHQI